MEEVASPLHTNDMKPPWETLVSVLLGTSAPWILLTPPRTFSQSPFSSPSFISSWLFLLHSSHCQCLNEKRTPLLVSHRAVLPYSLCITSWPITLRVHLSTQSLIKVLGIFSCDFWPSICLLWRNVYLALVSICWLSCLLFWYWVAWAVCVYSRLIPCQLPHLQIFFPILWVMLLFYLWFPLPCKSF